MGEDGIVVFKYIINRKVLLSESIGTGEGLGYFSHFLNSLPDFDSKKHIFLRAQIADTVGFCSWKLSPAFFDDSGAILLLFMLHTWFYYTIL